MLDLSFSADSTGTHSLHTNYKDYEIMFHVSTMLPYTPNNKQQVWYFLIKLVNKVHVCSSFLRNVVHKVFSFNFVFYIGPL